VPKVGLELHSSLYNTGNARKHAESEAVSGCKKVGAISGSAPVPVGLRGVMRGRVVACEATVA
jgi:hypothetical protein